MNTPGSMALGWGLLLVAGGGGLYLAKKDINERRREMARRGIRPTDTREWHERIAADQKPGSSELREDGETREDPETSSPPQLTGLSHTFSKFDRPYQQLNSTSSKPTRNEQKPS